MRCGGRFSIAPKRTSGIKTIPALVTSLLFLCASVAHSADINHATRVRQARQHHGQALRHRAAELGLPYPVPRLYLRIFKREGLVELWAGRPGRAMQIFQRYEVCASSGVLGPKRQRGDLQVPEGFYHLSRFNPTSSYHLSIKVSYPNALDRHFKTARDPGGDIYIHGDCVTIGCIPIQDDPIEQLFIVALDSQRAGQRFIPVHIFPARMDAAGWRVLRRAAGDDQALIAFWRQFVPVYRQFERSHRVPLVHIDKKRWRYQIDRVTHRPE